MSSTDFPTNFTSSDLTAYGKAVGTIFGGFGVAAIVLSMVMICIFIKFCCTSPKDSQQFKKNIHLMIAASVSLIAVVGCGVGWGYNKECNDGVASMTGAVAELFNSSANLIDNVDLTVINISAALDSKTKDMSRIQFGGLLAPIAQILDLIDDMQVKTDNLYNVTVGAANNVTEIKHELVFVHDTGAEVGLEGVPSPDEIPDINTGFESSIISGNNSINDMRNTTLNVNTTVSNSLSTIDNQLIEGLSNQTADYHNKVNDLTNNFDNMRNELNNYETEFNSDYRPTVNRYSEQRTQVVNAILILPIVVGLLSAAGIFFRIPKLLALTCALSFICFFWYVLIAGVNYTLWVVTDGFCAKQSIIVDSVLSNMNSQFTVPGTNNTYPTGQKIGELIQCSGDNTLVNVLEVGFLISDLETQVKQQAQNISRQAHSMNFDSDYHNATQDLSNYKNNTVDLDFSQQKNLTNVEVELHNNTMHLNDTLVKTTADLDYSLAQTNLITMNTTYNNGTKVRAIFWAAANISLLDCNDATYSDTKNQQELCTWAGYAYANDTLYLIEISLFNNLTDIEVKVNALDTDVGVLDGTQTYLHTTVNSIQTLLDNAYGMTNQYIDQIDDGVNAIYNVIADGANALAADTQCAFIGKFYNNFSGGFCKQLSPSLRVIAAMMLLGAASLFGSAVLSAVSIYKIKGSGEDDDDDYSDSKA